MDHPEPLAGTDLYRRPVGPQPAGTEASPLVTVVVTCFNQARFLAQSIDSVLRQTWRPLEIIVVDDGSQDDTSRVAESYPGVIVIRQPNGGLAAARNAGLQAGRGQYLSFLDADDLLLPGALEHGVRSLAAHSDWAFVSGGYRYGDESGNALGEPIVPDLVDDHYPVLLRANCIGMHAAVLYRAEAIRRAGGFEAALSACEDWDLYLRLARNFPVGQHREVVAIYRQHDANMSRDAGLMLRNGLAVLKRQAVHCRGDRLRRAARRSGIRWLEHGYGGPFLQQCSARRGGLKGILDLAVRAPGSLCRCGVRQLAYAAYHRNLALLPERWRDRITGWQRRLRLRPLPGLVRFGSLRRVTPIAGDFGFGRGRPVDRYYIEAFLQRHAQDVRGRVLEFGDDAYTRRFGGVRVSHRDVMNLEKAAPNTTFAGDLADARRLPPNAFDCVILTQVLQFVDDLPGAVAALHRALRPDGVVLATMPGITPMHREDWPRFWCFTPVSARRLFEQQFVPARVEAEAHGNVLAAIAFLHGLAAEELRPAEFEHDDPAYPVVITIRAVKAAGA